jgi:TldD protein
MEDQQALAGAALDAARAAGASYADVRINRYRSQYIGTREDRVLSIRDDASFGFGVRVLCQGAWGFAAGSRVTPEALAQAAQDAVAIARANAPFQPQPVELAPITPQQGYWATPIKRDVFEVPLSEKVDLLLGINQEALKAKGTKFCRSFLYALTEHKLFVSTEGTLTEQDIARVWPSFSVTAVSDDGSDFQNRDSFAPPMGRGYEYVEETDLLGDARQAGEDAVQKLKSPGIAPGVRDLILMPSHLWLVIHESIGHATELDRALGFEANFAGTSFVTPDQLGKLQYGSSIVNVVGDRTDAGGLATVGYDDEGVPAMRFDIIKDGVFVGYQTMREQAHWVGDTASHACCYADSYASVPMQRMPNVSLMPGKTPLSPDDLVAGIEDGVLIHGNGSWSIDQQRRNFQFGGQLFYEIKHGRVTGMLRDVAFQGITPQFWNSCDAICSEEHYALHGTYNCGKAEPTQAAPASHGSAPARFRGVTFLNTRQEA